MYISATENIADSPSQSFPLWGKGRREDEGKSVRSETDAD